MGSGPQPKPHEEFGYESPSLPSTLGVRCCFSLAHGALTKCRMHIDMRPRFPVTRAALSTAVSLWIAGFACVTGCTQLVFASAETTAQMSSGETNSETQSHADLTGDMEAPCHHHSSGGPSAPTGQQHPASHTAVSCCPLEATFTKKPHPTAPLVGSALAVIPVVSLHSAPASVSVIAVYYEALWHSGRDTLLQTNLLRI
jgi:hypothetical protein